MTRRRRFLIAGAVTLALLFALHMAAAGGATVTVRCAGLDGDVVDATLRRDAVILTPVGIVLARTNDRPVVVETCEETDEP